MIGSRGTTRLPLLADTKLDRQRQNAYKSLQRGEALRTRHATTTPRARASAPHHAGEGETAMPFYDKGDVHIRYEEAGAGFRCWSPPVGA